MTTIQADANDPDSFSTFALGDFPLQQGGTIPSAHLAYKTIGSPHLPAIIYPTWYSGSIADNLWLTGRDKHLSPERYFIIMPALFGNGQSTSPSNSALRPWPVVTFHDNVRAQHRLVTEGFGVRRAKAVLGWSMGAAQTFQWATQYPEFMERVVPFCGSARTSLHNRVFLEGVKSALVAAKGVSSRGVCEGPVSEADYAPWGAGEREVGLKALGRVYAGWGFSQAFYREKVYEKAPMLGFGGLEDFMVGFWERWALSKDPENLLAMLSTWQHGDVSNQEPYRGDFKAAMQAIKAKALILPSETDLYFPPEDSEIEVANMRPGTGTMEAFPSIWGHWAGGPGQSTEDVKWLDGKLRGFLEDGLAKE